MLLHSGCSTVQASTALSGDAADATSPLSAYLNVVYGLYLSPEERAARLLAQETRVADLTAQCMKAQGFDYVPYLGSFGGGGDGPDVHLDDRAWVTQHGYGIMDGLYLQPAPAAMLADPNMAHRATLSPAEQEAWDTALFDRRGYSSRDQSSLQTGQQEPYEWQRAGCMGSAQHQWEVENPTQSSDVMRAEFSPLFDAIDTFYATWDQDASHGPLPFDVAWVDCMTATGFPGYERQLDAFNQFQAQELEHASTNGFGPAETQEWKDREVALALADLDCRTSTNYQALRQKAQWAAEAQFVADHQQDLNALRARVEQGVSATP
jgi:hypothetical protein